MPNRADAGADDYERSCFIRLHLSCPYPTGGNMAATTHRIAPVNTPQIAGGRRGGASVQCIAGAAARGVEAVGSVRCIGVEALTRCGEAARCVEAVGSVRYVGVEALTRGVEAARCGEAARCAEAGG